MTGSRKGCWRAGGAPYVWKASRAVDDIGTGKAAAPYGACEVRCEIGSRRVARMTSLEKVGKESVDCDLGKTPANASRLEKIGGLSGGWHSGRFIRMPGWHWNWSVLDELGICPPSTAYGAGLRGASARMGGITRVGPNVEAEVVVQVEAPPRSCHLLGCTGLIGVTVFGRER